MIRQARDNYNGSGSGSWYRAVRGNNGDGGSGRENKIVIYIMLRIKNNLITMSLADSDSGNICYATAQILVYLLNLNLKREVSGSNKKTGNNTLIAMAHNINKYRADGNRGSDGKVQAQCHK